jgi:FK506-binding nuclear protein
LKSQSTSLNLHRTIRSERLYQKRIEDQKYSIMGRKRRGPKEDDYDDSLERSFQTKRLKPESASEARESKSSPDAKVEVEKNKNNNNKSNNDASKNKDDKDNIERLREKKRLKKLRQKEKKLAAQKEQEKLETLQEKQRKQREKQRKEAKKQKERVQKVATDPNAFVKTSMGVRYADIVVGRGPVIVDRKRVVCQYVLRAEHKKGKLLDSGDSFSFHVGKGEVIKGWDIGLKGMRQGGKRHIIVPPKAGYGTKDIGGGSGAILYFEVTLLQC